MGKSVLFVIWAGATIMGCSSASKPAALGTDTMEGGAASSSGVVGASGSSSSSGSSTGSSGGGASGSSGAGADGAQPMGGFTVAAVVSDAVSVTPLAGASACLLASPSTCTTTDSAGSFTLDGLAATGDGFTASLSGYVTGIWPITPTGNVSGWTVELRSTTRVGNLAQSVGTTFGSSTGALVFAAFDSAGNNLAGVSVSVGATGKLVYFKADGSALDPTLTATTAWGGGYVFDVPPGTTGVTFSATGKVCARNGVEGWTGGAGQTMTVPVAGGRLTRAAAVCQ